MPPTRWRPSRRRLPAKVKAVIWLFMTGAQSQVDTWDYKPELQKRDGQPLAGADVKTGFFTTSGKCLKSPFEWKQYGQSGTWVSSLFPHLSQHVDDMTFLHGMYLRANNHAPAAIELMCGENRPGLPSMGAWVTYGLGTENQNLPAFVVMHDTRPRGDDQIWSAGFLPKTYQALALDARRKEAIDNLARDAKHSDEQQRAQLELIRQLNQEHAQARPTQADLAARINAYELAYRMQMAAPEALDIAKESDGHAQAVRTGQTRVRHVRPAVPDRAAADRTRRAVRPDLRGPGFARRRQRERRAVGRTLGHPEQPHVVRACTPISRRPPC